MNTAPGRAGVPTRAQVLCVFAAVILAWVALIGFIAYLMADRLQARLDVRGLQLTLDLPAGLQAHATPRAAVTSRLDTRLRLRVPFDQAVRVDLPDELVLRAQANVRVPIDTTFHIRSTIPVTGVLRAKVPVRTWLPELEVDVPVRFDVPIDVSLPLQARVPVGFDQLLRTRVQEAIRVPLRALLNVEAPIRSPVQGELVGHATFTTTENLQVPVVLRADTLRASVAPGHAD